MKLHSFFNKTVCSLAFAFVSTLAVAQDNYTIKMSLKAEGLPQEYAAFAEMDIVTYIKGDKMKNERTGMMGSSVSVYDGKKMTSLNENMGQKFGFTATKAELEVGEKSEKPKITYTGEKKMIAGYECSKVIATSTDKDKKEVTMTVWTTDKIKYNHPEAQKSGGKGIMDLSEMKGYPLAMEMLQNMQGTDIKIIITTTEISTAPVDDSVFVLNTEGYTMMSYKEMLDKQKSMSQGK